MTESPPAYPPPAPRKGARESLRLNQILGLLIVVGALGSILWLTVVAQRRCSDPDLPFVAYVPGQIELRADTRVEFYTQCVGRIDAVEPGVTALQVSVERPGPLGERESVTLSPTDPEADLLGGAVTLSMSSPTEVAIGAEGASWSVRRQPDGLWTWDGPPLPSGDTPPGGLVRPGTVLELSGVQVRWNELGRFTRVEGYVDASAYARVATKAGLAEPMTDYTAALGAGTAIRVGSSIGIGNTGPPRVRLVPAYTRSALVAERGGRREFSPEDGPDVLAFLGEALDYLASPAKTDAPPVNRYERMVDDLNGSLSEVRTALGSARKLADTLGSVADAGADQLAGRLVLGQRQLGVIEGALTTIDSVLTTVEARVSEDPEAPLLANLLLDDEQTESLDATIDNVRSLSTELRNGEQTVFTRIAGEDHGVRFDSIMSRTERLSARAEDMLAGLEESGGGAARGAKIYGVVTALAQALSTIAVIGIWR